MLPVTVIIVTHNSADVIMQCLESVRNAARVIVVDNNSQDNTCALIQQGFPQVEYIVNKENAGFGRANNLALDKVHTPFALLLNPDAVMQEEALAHLLQASECYPDAAILAPRLFGEDGQMQQSYKLSIFDREKSRVRNNHPAEGDVCAGFLSGAVMLLRMQSFQQCGFFDPKIFLYYEDDDLCIRARNAGYGLVWVYKAEAVHLCGKSSPVNRHYLYKKNWHLTWSRLYLEKKYHGKRAALKLKITLLAGYAVKTLFYTILLREEKMVRYYARMRAVLQF